MISAKTELDRFLDRSTVRFEEAIDRLMRAHLEGTDAHAKALWELAELLKGTLQLADLNGRKRGFMELDRARRRSAYAAGETLIPSIPFDEAIDDLASRMAKWVDPKKVASVVDEVARLYSTEHVFAMSYAIDQKITARIQRGVGKIMREGEGLPEAEELMEDVASFPRSYAATVYRNNVSHAYTNGRFEQAQDPEVADTIVGLKYVGIKDDATRPNHEAAFGFIAPTDHPHWHRVKPPLGHQCRCSVEFYSKYDAERDGLWKDGRLVPYYPPNWFKAGPDQGFLVGAF